MRRILRPAVLYSNDVWMEDCRSWYMLQFHLGFLLFPSFVSGYLPVSYHSTEPCMNVRYTVCKPYSLAFWTVQTRDLSDVMKWTEGCSEGDQLNTKKKFPVRFRCCFHWKSSPSLFSEYFHTVFLDLGELNPKVNRSWWDWTQRLLTELSELVRRKREMNSLCQCSLGQIAWGKYS